MKVYLIFGRGLIVSGPLDMFREYLTVLGGHQHSSTVEPTFLQQVAVYFYSNLCISLFAVAAY